MIVSHHKRPPSRRVFSALSVGLVLLFVASQTSAQTTPWGWTPADVGAPATTGTAAFSPGLIAMSSSGAEVNGTTDQFSFLYRPITGDATVIARVSSFTNVDPFSQAGVMIRESTDPGARHAFVFVTGGNGVGFRRRLQTGGATEHTSGLAGAAPVWLKVERRGTTLTASRSADGAVWTPFGTASVSMAPTVLVGLAVSSHKLSGSVLAGFTSVMVVGDGTLPPGWSGRDVGHPTLSGGSGAAGPTFTLDGSGTGVGGMTDQFRYVFKQVSGDADIVARVAGFETATPGARAGVMIRQALTGNSAHASLLAAPQN